MLTCRVLLRRVASSYAARRALLALVLGGCEGASSQQPDAVSDVDGALDATPDAGYGLDPTRLVPSCFTGGDSPQLDLTAPISNWTWNDPHVLAVGDEYWMYASATNSFQYPVRLYRLTAPDAMTWTGSMTPILDVGAADTWDAGGVETPSVVSFKGGYHVFYTGYRYAIGDPMHTITDYSVGHATSTDGVTFARVGAAPRIAPSGTDGDPSNDWYALVAAEPGAVVVGDTLHVYFSAYGTSPTLGVLTQSIGVVRTTDGISWTAPELVLEPDQTLYPRAQDWTGYSTPNALVLPDGVHLFVDVARQPNGGSWAQLRIHHARSADGLTGWRSDPAPIRSAGDFAWAVNEVRAPHALLDGTVLRLWLAGHEIDGAPPEHFAIGMVTCDLGMP